MRKIIIEVDTTVIILQRRKLKLNKMFKVIQPVFDRVGNVNLISLTLESWSCWCSKILPFSSLRYIS